MKTSIALNHQGGCR